MSASRENVKGCSQCTDDKHFAAPRLHISLCLTRARATPGPARPKQNQKPGTHHKTTRHNATSEVSFYHESMVGLRSDSRRWTLTTFDIMARWRKDSRRWTLTTFDIMARWRKSFFKQFNDTTRHGRVWNAVEPSKPSSVKPVGQFCFQSTLSKSYSNQSGCPPVIAVPGLAISLTLETPGARASNGLFLRQAQNRKVVLLHTTLSQSCCKSGNAKTSLLAPGLRAG